ncbi:hypothetical protein BK133_11115 [Paenibacillus sp. FSL H8-0548]|uniref:hypothetical protein n=1 Tax=Paenibacillus sp. FSL H8-0548 TaxID=1920422 RepID=UPI00096C74D0|nr:hypothetical protein [Paenibacillus sp. FSL H8-0548]OMF35251.1 hypothetical protein BK133_11115 [Paenibacillus sp. FSL H8-0548]
MENYIINYNTGITEEVSVADLQEAKEIAKAGINYTQQNITIESLNGEEITTARWCGVRPSEEDEVLEIIGGGFYQTWSDDLGE